MEQNREGEKVRSDYSRGRERMIEQKLIKRVRATEKERENWRKNKERERSWLLYGYHTENSPPPRDWSTVGSVP
jgi:hypothetical protein